MGVEGFQQKVIQVIQEPASDGDTQNGSSGACVPNLASEIE